MEHIKLLGAGNPLNAHGIRFVKLHVLSNIKQYQLDDSHFLASKMEHALNHDDWYYLGVTFGKLCVRLRLALALAYQRFGISNAVTKRFQRFYDVFSCYVSSELDTVVGKQVPRDQYYLQLSFETPEAPVAVIAVFYRLGRERLNLPLPKMRPFPKTFTEEQRLDLLDLIQDIASFFGLVRSMLTKSTTLQMERLLQRINVPAA